MTAYKIGQKVYFNNDLVTIIKIFKGAKTNKRNIHSGFLYTGYKSNPCTYLLSNGYRVRGITLKKT